MKSKLIGALVCLLIYTTSLFSQNPTATPVPFVKSQWLDSSGNPLASGVLRFYATGTATPLAAYTSYLQAGSFNTLTLDAAGRGNVFLGPSCYTITALNSAGTQQWSVDGVCDLALLQTLNFATQLDDKVAHCSQYTGATAGAKIAAAIAALPSTGGTVDCRGLEGAQSITVDAWSGVTKPGRIIFGAATFTISADQTIPASWVIEGSGNQTVLSMNSSTNQSIFSVTGSNVYFKNFKMSLTQTSSTVRGIQFDAAASNIYVDNVYFLGVGSITNDVFCLDIAGFNLSNLYVTNSRFENVDYVIIKGNSDTSVTTNTVFDNIVVSGTASGINVNHPDATGSWTDTTVVNSYFDTMSTSGGWGVGISGQNAQRVTIANNYFTNCNQECVHVENYAKGIVITGNRFLKQGTTTASRGMVHAISCSQDIIIGANFFDLGTVTTNGSAGYAMDAVPGGGACAPTDVTFSGNEVLTRSGNLGVVAQEVLNMVLSNNTFRNPLASSKAAYFIDLSLSAAVGTGNTFYNPGVLVNITDALGGAVLSHSFISGDLTTAPAFAFLGGNAGSSTSLPFDGFTISRDFIIDNVATANALFPAGTMFDGILGARFSRSTTTSTFTSKLKLMYDGTTLVVADLVNSAVGSDTTGWGTFAITGSNVTAVAARGAGAATGTIVLTFTGAYIP